MNTHPLMLYKNPGTSEEEHRIVADEIEETSARGQGWIGYYDTPEPKGPGDPKPLEEMKAGELLNYAQKKGYDIGDLKPQHGAEKILAAIKAAEAAKTEGQA